MPVADITANKLDYTPAANASGSPYTTFTFQVQDDGGTASGGVDLDQSANTITVNVTARQRRPERHEQDGHDQRGSGLHAGPGGLRLHRHQRQPGRTRCSPSRSRPFPAPVRSRTTASRSSPGPSIPLADITANKLVFTPAATGTARRTPPSRSRSRTTAARPTAAPTSTRAPTRSRSTSRPSRTRPTPGPTPALTVPESAGPTALGRPRQRHRSRRRHAAHHRRRPAAHGVVRDHRRRDRPDLRPGPAVLRHRLFTYTISDGHGGRRHRDRPADRRQGHHGRRPSGLPPSPSTPRRSARRR